MPFFLTLSSLKRFVEVKFLEASALQAKGNSEISDMLDRGTQALSNIDPFDNFPDQLTPNHLPVWRILSSPQAGSSKELILILKI
jgi:hypothetical protein